VCPDVGKGQAHVPLRREGGSPCAPAAGRRQGGGLSARCTRVPPSQVQQRLESLGESERLVYDLLEEAGNKGAGPVPGIASVPGGGGDGAAIRGLAESRSDDQPVNVVQDLGLKFYLSPEPENELLPPVLGCGEGGNLLKTVVIFF